LIIKTKKEKNMLPKLA